MFVVSLVTRKPQAATIEKYFARTSAKSLYRES
jgi:hypothetical protein